MRRLVIPWLLCSSLLGASMISHAVEPQSGTMQEIQQLLGVLASSKCQFNRNGEWYSPNDAVKHLGNKLDVLVGKGKIGTTEDFIRLAASESSVSGTPYQVQCQGQPAVQSGPWLTAQLGQLRQHNKPQ